MNPAVLNWIFNFFSNDKYQIELQKVGPRMAKLALSLIKIMKYGIVQFCYMNFSDLAKTWHFCTPIIVYISVTPPLNPKTFEIPRIIFIRSKGLW